MGLDYGLCVGCNFVKSHHLPFSLNNTHCDLPFDRLHCDVWGPSPICSTGFQYYAVLIDDCIRFNWFFSIKTQIWFFLIPLSTFNIILRLNFLPKLSPSNMMVELNLQIINFALISHLVVLCSALLTLIHRVKIGLLNINADMSLK